MESKTFIIPNITCGHCIMNIKRELEEIEGVSSVEGDPNKKEISVVWDSPATEDEIITTLKEINYPPED